MRCEAASNAGDLLLDGIMPDYQFREVHSVVVKASGAQIFAALGAVTPGELPLFRFLMTMRSLPARATGHRQRFGSSSDSLLGQAMQAGFLVLGEEAEREFVLGTVGQPWRLLGATPPAVRTAEDFAAFNVSGFAKIATNFRYDEAESQPGPRLSTETRVWLPDSTSQRRFAIYWMLIRPGSGLIRREWLRRTKERAEAAG